MAINTHTTSTALAREDNHSNRRAVLRGLLAAPLAAAPLSAALAASPNPIPALIAAHRAARTEHQAASEARDLIEQPLIPYGIDGRMTWEEAEARVPGLTAAIDRSARAIEAEEEAFRALLTAAVNYPDGFMLLARHACEITEEDEGPAVEGASVAYRMLAAFAGFDCWTEEPVEG